MRHFTPLKIVGALFLVLILYFVFAPLGPTLTRAPGTQSLSNMKQLYLATQQMALDATTDGKAISGWPGNHGGSFTNWTHQLVPAYLSTNDLARLLSDPSHPLPADQLPSTNKNSILVYAVREDSAANTVFLSTANFTNTPTGGRLNPSAHPLGKTFVLFHKDGSGSVRQARDVGKTNLIGSYAPLCH